MPYRPRFYLRLQARACGKSPEAVICHTRDTFQREPGDLPVLPGYELIEFALVSIGWQCRDAGKAKGPVAYRRGAFISEKEQLYLV